jgi:hypothetical protein
MQTQTDFYIIHPEGTPVPEATPRYNAEKYWEMAGIRHLYKPMYSESFEANICIRQLERVAVPRFTLSKVRVMMGTANPKRGRRPKCSIVSG